MSELKPSYERLENNLIELKAAYNLTRVEDWRADAVKHAQEVLELRARLSTLLKASEGMEKALELFTERYDTWVSRGFTEYLNEHLVEWNPVGHYRKAKQALADFRAVKEGK